MMISLGRGFPVLEPSVIQSAFQPVSVLDVRSAIFRMGPLKAPGIDVLPAGFFQKHWKVVGQGVTQFVLESFAGITDIAGINETLLVLIPKIDNPINITNSGPLVYAR